MPFKHFSSTLTTTDSSLTMDAAAPDLCTFDSTGTTFDTVLRTFDQTSCQEVSPSDVTTEQGGGTSKRKRRKPKYWSDFTPEVAEVITAVAAAQVAEPQPETVRIAHLKSALRVEQIEMEMRHIQALDQAREEMIGVEVAKYLRELQNREDEALILALAEAL